MNFASRLLPPVRAAFSAGVAGKQPRFPRPSRPVTQRLSGKGVGSIPDRSTKLIHHESSGRRKICSRSTCQRPSSKRHSMFHRSSISFVHAAVLPGRHANRTVAQEGLDDDLSAHRRGDTGGRKAGRDGGQGPGPGGPQADGGIAPSSSAELAPAFRLRITACEPYRRATELRLRSARCPSPEGRAPPAPPSRSRAGPSPGRPGPHDRALCRARTRRTRRRPEPRSRIPWPRCRT